MASSPGRPRPIITLTTDFGLRDGYVAAMKGVVLGISPEVTLVDISHEIPPHDVAHAAFVVGSICSYFPAGTIHVAVVDPGVGTDRNPLLVTTTEGTYVAPDNGLLTYVYERHAAVGSAGQDSDDAFMTPTMVPVPEGCAAYTLDREEYRLRHVSSTFHGRDIFAPAAAHLSAGVQPDDLGTPVDSVVCLNVPRPRVCDGGVEGRIIYVDRFGNMVCNIRAEDVAGGIAEVEIEGRRIPGLSSSYAGDGLLAIVGSHGYVEVAVTEGSAAEYLGAGLGARVRAVLSKGHTTPTACRG